MLLYNSFTYLDPDFGWHLRFGEIIWQTKSVPHDQIFMWPLEGKTWVDHEWLSNLVMYTLWSLGGYLAVSFFFALLPLATFFVINFYLFKNFIKRTEAQIVLAVIEVVAFFGMKPHLGVRVQEVTVLALSLLLITLHKNLLDRSSIPPWWLPVLFYVWACSHAGFLIGLFILCLWVVTEAILFFFPRIFKETKRLTKENLIQWTIISGLSFISTLLTPYGFHLYSFLSEYRDNFYLSRIQEWLPPYAFPIKYTQIGLILLVISSSATIFGVLKKKIPIFYYLATLLFIILSLKSIRHFPLLMVTWIILIIPYFLPEITSRLTIPVRKISTILLIVCLGFITIYFFNQTYFTNSPLISYCKDYPCGATVFLLKHPEYNKKIFNSYNFGGYLIGAAPELRLFIDGRLPQYPYNDKSMLAEYYEFNKPDFTRQKLDEHQITTVFDNKPRPLKKVNWFEKYFLGYKNFDYPKFNPVTNYVSVSPNWQKVYEDDLSLIYVRK